MREYFISIYHYHPFSITSSENFFSIFTDKVTLWRRDLRQEEELSTNLQRNHKL